ncbi:hypothetical protein M4578_11235 [Salipiger sp. P9]|uniref:hypothetical protein n=1 Tax=Salipiger pentaromativorans TaxID=2943193 RepID=UPI0021583B94|nr:hypothetical protein [Salipiger pentaromativorans]MCR8548406.1 hypothetical protein [Salipiger pentaromativorans]
MTAALDVPGAGLRADELIALRATALAGPAALPACGGDCVLVADFRPSMLRGLIRAFRSVAAAEALALIGWRVAEAGGGVGLLALAAGEPVRVPPGGMVAVIRGLVRAHEAAAAHALAGRLDDPPLDRALAPLRGLAAPGSALVIASGFETPGGGLADRLDGLARAHPLRLLHVTDGAGAEPGVVGQPLLSIDASLPPEATVWRLGALFPPDLSRAPWGGSSDPAHR